MSDIFFKVSNASLYLKESSDEEEWCKEMKWNKKEKKAEVEIEE